MTSLAICGVHAVGEQMDVIFFKVSGMTQGEDRGPYFCPLIGLRVVAP